MLRGHAIALPSRLIEIARFAGASDALFSCGVDLASGRSQLWIETLPPDSSVDAIMPRYAEHLDNLLREVPKCWIMQHEDGGNLRGQSDAQTCD
ncbi:MAG: hypothetical protein ABIW82_05300 [Dokdonella sp.]